MDISSPRVIKRHFDGNYAYDAVVVGGVAYVADREEGLEII